MRKALIPSRPRHAELLEILKGEKTVQIKGLPNTQLRAYESSDVITFAYYHTLIVTVSKEDTYKIEVGVWHNKTCYARISVITGFKMHTKKTVPYITTPQGDFKYFSGMEFKRDGTPCF